jgi:hypothetical protein
MGKHTHTHTSIFQIQTFYSSNSQLSVSLRFKLSINTNKTAHTHKQPFTTNTLSCFFPLSSFAFASNCCKRSRSSNKRVQPQHKQHHRQQQAPAICCFVQKEVRLQTGFLARHSLLQVSGVKQQQCTSAENKELCQTVAFFKFFCALES